MRVFFQADPLSSLKAGFDTTLLLAFEGCRRGHEVRFYPWQSLSSFSGQRLVARARRVAFSDPERWEEGPVETVDLSQADVIFVRQDPPFDAAYATSLYLLDELRQRCPDVLVTNDPRGVLRNPEKILPLRFPQFTPPTLVSKNREDIIQFHRAHGDVVFKPLYGYGGSNVIRVSSKDTNVSALVSIYAEQLYREPFVVQKYLPGIREKGDKRLLLVDGELIGGFVRVPPADDFRANTICGSTISPLEPDDSDRRISDALGPHLREHGLHFVGVDIIDSFLTEVNLTSPGGAYFYDQLHVKSASSHVWDALERRKGSDAVGRAGGG